MGRLFKDFLLSLIVSGAVLVSVGAAIDQSDGMLLWLLVSIPGILLCLAAPVLFWATAIFRPGYALGFVLPFILGPIFSFAEIEQNRAALQAQEVWHIEKPLPGRQTIFMSETMGRCDDLCIALLNQRNDAIIIKPFYHRWMDRYVKDTGEICRPSPNTRRDEQGRWSYDALHASLDFLSIGVADTCWSRNAITHVPDSIVISSYWRGSSRSKKSARQGLDGNVYAISAISNGKETLLARRFQGRLTTRIPSLLLWPAQMFGLNLLDQTIGSKDTRTEFYRDALGIDLVPMKIEGPQLAATLGQLLNLMKISGEYRGDAMNTVQRLIDQAGTDQAAFTFPFVRDLMMARDPYAFQSATWLLATYDNYKQDAEEIDRLLQRGSRDDTIFALMRLRDFGGTHLPSQYQPVILRALESSDPELIFAGLVALGYKQPAERAFAQEAVTRIASAPASAFLALPLAQALGQPLPGLR